MTSVPLYHLSFNSMNQMLRGERWTNWRLGFHGRNCPLWHYLSRFNLRAPWKGKCSTRGHDLLLGNAASSVHLLCNMSSGDISLLHVWMLLACLNALLHTCHGVDRMHACLHGGHVIIHPAADYLQGLSFSDSCRCFQSFPCTYARKSGSDLHPSLLIRCVKEDFFVCMCIGRKPFLRALTSDQRGMLLC